MPNLCETQIVETKENNVSVVTDISKLSRDERIKLFVEEMSIFLFPYLEVQIDAILQLKSLTEDQMSSLIYKVADNHIWNYGRVEETNKIKAIRKKYFPNKEESSDIRNITEIAYCKFICKKMEEKLKHFKEVKLEQYSFLVQIQLYGDPLASFNSNRVNGHRSCYGLGRLSEEDLKWDLETSVKDALLEDAFIERALILLFAKYLLSKEIKCELYTALTDKKIIEDFKKEKCQFMSSKLFY